MASQNNGFDDPFVASHFTIEIDGKQVAQFKGMAGIKMEVGTKEHTAVDKNGKQVAYSIPTGNKPGKLTLEVPATTSLALIEWLRQSQGGGQHPNGQRSSFASARKTLSIIQYDITGNECMRFNVNDGWVSSSEYTGMKSDGGEIMMEKHTIEASAIDRVK